MDVAAEHLPLSSHSPARITATSRPTALLSDEDVAPVGHVDGAATAEQLAGAAEACAPSGDSDNAVTIGLRARLISSAFAVAAVSAPETTGADGCVGGSLVGGTGVTSASTTDYATAFCGTPPAPARAVVIEPTGVHGDADLGPEPALKRRRVGRRLANPDMTADERRRLRTLKNRESAMKSLQKKAEYASKLEADKRTQREIVATQRDSLQHLVQASTVLRSELLELPDHAHLAGLVDECIDRCREAIVDSVAETLDT